MKKITVLVLLLILFPKLRSQSPNLSKANSLENIIYKAKKDTNLVNLLLDYYWVAPKAEQLKIIQHAAQVSNKIKYEKGLYVSNLNLGLYYQLQGSYAKALSILLENMKRQEKLQEWENTALLQSCIGSLYSMLGEVDKSISYYKLTVVNLSKTKNYKVLEDQMQRLASAYYSTGNYDLALDINIKSIELGKKKNSTSTISGAYSNMTAIYNRLHKYSEAFQCANEYIKIMDKSDSTHGHLLLGSVYAAKGDLLTALTYDEKAWESSKHKDIKALAEVGFICLQIAAQPSTANKQTYLLKAINSFKQAIDSTNTQSGSTNNVFRNELYLKLSMAQAQLHNYKDAYINQQKYFEETDSLENSIHHSKIIQLQNKIEFDKIQAEENNAQLFKDIKVKDELDFQRNIRDIALFCLLILSILLLYINNQRKKIKIEKRRSEDLLLNILPEKIADQLISTGKTEALLYNNVSVLFTDFVNFSELSEQLSPMLLVKELNECYSAFDVIFHKFNIEKIKALGDGILAVSGLPISDPHHAINMVNAAIEIRNFIDHRKLMNPITCDIRIGINSGKVVAGIVGINKFAYDIWGDTVNIAARMEQNGIGGKVNISQSTYDLIKNQFTTEYRGEIEAKNKGILNMYFAEKI